MSVLRLYLIALLWATLGPTTLPAPYVFAGQASTPEKTTPQGQHLPGADNSQPPNPQTKNEVIPPPPIGDEDIYTEAPNPEAGHKEEVIPPPAPTPDSGPASRLSIHL